MGEKILEAEETKRRNRELFLTAITGTQRINHYKKIENLIPKETSTFNRVLASLAQNQLMKDKGFRLQLSNIEDSEIYDESDSS